MDQATVHLSAPSRSISSKTRVLAYFHKVLTPDRWTPISSHKVAIEVGISQSNANKAIQALAADGMIERQYGYGRKDACAYRLPRPPAATRHAVTPQPPVKPGDSLGQTIRNMRELERIMGDLPPASASFQLLLKARGDLLRLTAALRSGNAAEAVERLGVLFEMVSPDFSEITIEGEMLRSAMQDFRRLVPAA